MHLDSRRIGSSGVSENKGSLVWGPYNKDPTI